MRTHERRRVGATLIGAAALVLVACSGGQQTQSETAATPAAGPEAATGTAAPEVSNARMGVTFDGGIMIVEESSMKHIADLRQEGFLRLNPAGDQRHLLVSTAEGFQLLDTGVEIQGHDDHLHLYGHEPTLTDTVFPAPKPGHAVLHADRLALFSDEAGTIQVLDPHDVAKGPSAARVTKVDAHHGVAIPTADNRMIVSLPDRTGVNILDSSGGVVATNNQCPGVHGEATAHDAVTVGCTDGSLVIRDGEITKVQSPDAYGRMGNQAGSHESDIVLADYKIDKDAKLERPTRIALINTGDDTVRLVDLPASYTFRSLGRGPEGEALVLTTDGNLTIIDEKAGKVVAAIKVTEPWEESETWQDPRPTLRVVGNIAYVTEPPSLELHAVHLPSERVVDTVTLPHAPNEIQDVGLGAEADHHD